MRVWLMALLFALALWQPAHAQQLLTPREFVDAAIATIQQSEPDARFERRGEFELFVQDAAIPEAPLNLGGAYDQYRADPSKLTEILVQATHPATTELEEIETADRLMVLIQPRALTEQLARESAAVRARNNLPSSELIWRPFGGDLAEVMIFVDGETQVIAMTESLDRLGLSPEAAWALASTDLSNRLGEVQVGSVTRSRHLMRVTGGNGLAPSSLVDRAFCATRERVNFVFLLVEPGAYVMADRTERRAMEEFRAFHRRVVRNRSTFSTTPLACENGQMQPILVD